MTLFIEKIVTGKWKENCYLVYNHSKDCVIIDPGNDYDKINCKIEALNIRPLAIFNTHAHFDHIGAIVALKEKFTIPLYLHKGDLKLLKHANLYRILFGEDYPIAIPDVEFFPVENTYKIGHIDIKIYETPGHTMGSVSLLIEKNLFCGDLLLKNKVGRTDLPGGNQDLLVKSLNKISRLSSSIKIHPGHGESTNLDFEKTHNNTLMKILFNHED